MNSGKRCSDCLQRKWRRAKGIFIEIQRNRPVVAAGLFEGAGPIALSQFANVGWNELAEVIHLRTFVFRGFLLDLWAGCFAGSLAMPTAACNFATSPKVSRRNSPGGRSRLSGP